MPNSVCLAICLTVQQISPRLRIKSEPRFCDGNALVLSSSGNHYHWLIKMLPRLHLVEEAGLSASDFRKLLINWPRPAHTVKHMRLPTFQREHCR